MRLSGSATTRHALAFSDRLSTMKVAGSNVASSPSSNSARVGDAERADVVEIWPTSARPVAPIVS
jgi:hypothetical protein